MEAYVTIEEAEAYFQGRLHADAWENASEGQKEKALVSATRAIDRLTLAGRKTDPEQPLAFPRHPDTEVPQAVKDACCEEALALLDRGDSQRRKLQAEGVTAISIGGLSETYATGGRGRSFVCPEARELLRPWLLGAVRIR